MELPHYRNWAGVNPARDCDRFTAGEVGVLLTLLEACEGCSVQPEVRRWMQTAKAKLEEQKRLLGD